LGDGDVTSGGVLHILFTMDCQPAAAPLGARGAPEGPKSWEQSARSIDGFCTRLGNAGYPATLFVTPECAEEHAPLLEELLERGYELGLYVQPQSLAGGGYKRYFGQYGREEQRGIVELAKQQFQAAVGAWPQSVRTGMFSASDATFGVLHELGFRQGSVSSPGRRIGQHAAVWPGAPGDAHYVDPQCRIRPGHLPFLEVPVTTDATQLRGGRSPDLAIENGTFEAWHRPLIEGQLQRMEAEGVAFRALCITTRNAFPYHSAGERQGAALEALITHLAALEERYEVVPTTMSGAHKRFRSPAWV
jgi:hypothetical protein